MRRTKNHDINDFTFIDLFAGIGGKLRRSW